MEIKKEMKIKSLDVVLVDAVLESGKNAEFLYIYHKGERVGVVLLDPGHKGDIAGAIKRGEME